MTDVQSVALNILCPLIMIRGEIRLHCGLTGSVGVKYRPHNKGALGEGLWNIQNGIQQSLALWSDQEYGQLTIKVTFS